MLKPYGIAILAVLLMAGMLAAQPATQPAAASAVPAFVVTPMRVQELRGADRFVYVESTTTLADLKQKIAELMKPLDAAMAAGKFQAEGPMIFVYNGMTADMSQPFTLQIGMPARQGAQTAGELKLRKLEPLRSASIVYSGPLSQIGQAYQRLYTDLFAAGLVAGGENREIYTYWEGPESANNVVVIQAGVK